MRIYRGNWESNIFFLKQTGLLRRKTKLLEVGSGSGYLVKHFKDDGHDVMGIEINTDFIKTAKDRFRVKLLKMSGDDLTFQRSVFDLVVSFDVFEHIENTDKHLQEVGRVLKSDGYYLLSTPNRLTNVPFEIIKERSLTKYKDYHCSLHNYWQIKSRFKKHGFKIRFFDVPVVTVFFREKMVKYLGGWSLMALKFISLDKLPVCLRTNFYIVAQKI